MNTETGQIKNMTDEEMKSAGGNWVRYNLVRIPASILYRRANRSKYTPHVGKKELARKSNGNI